MYRFATYIGVVAAVLVLMACGQDKIEAKDAKNIWVDYLVLEGALKGGSQQCPTYGSATFSLEQITYSWCANHRIAVDGSVYKVRRTTEQFIYIDVYGSVDFIRIEGRDHTPSQYVKDKVDDGDVTQCVVDLTIVVDRSGKAVDTMTGTFCGFDADEFSIPVQ